MDKKKKKKESLDEATKGRGPGVVCSKGHGPPGPVETVYGLAHLRRVLNLSADVDIERVCEDAALDLEKLRKEPTAPWLT